MSLLISTAQAATTGAHAQQGNPMFSTLIMLAGLIAIFYFFLWRPRSKQMKAQRDLLNALKIGEEVATAGGIVGKITRLDDGFLTLEIAQGVEITVQRSSVSGVLPKGTMKQTVKDKD